MIIKQVSIFLENRTGRLSEVTNLLAENSINIRTLSLADSSDYGVLRLIVNDPYKAVDILKDRGFTSSLTDMIALEVKDEPGGLAKVLERMQVHGLNVSYMYAFVEKFEDKAVVVFRFDETNKAKEIIEKDDILTFLAQDKIQLP